ncbi:MULTISPECIES: TetR/AcrR family transcriptional regulator [unclassified Mycobacterium]|uniref:TetR/AcrR family transcriptional regulator n=1 Tax=unclassified Mycobacterium TaxID=2642494 RepID=UPI0029C7641C|nr:MULTISPECIES: TetR/AcrR family transcriptional regulator [unclassified Mycobacterium]
MTPPGADRRQRLVDAARALFAEHPYDQVTTTAISKRAGVAYGLLAHHFENKRGIYRAAMNEIAVEIANVHLTAPPPDATLVEQLRHALRNHVDYIDSHAPSFVAFIRGDLGSDPEQQSAVNDLRWLGAQRILLALGITEPVPATLRTAMKGWVGALDEMMIDRIEHQDVDADVLVDLATATLVTTLKTVAAMDATLGLDPELLDAAYLPGPFGHRSSDPASTRIC